MKILITGGAGFIGSHTADILISRGHEVCIVDNLRTGKKENINKKARFYNVDICDRKKLAEVFEKEKPDAVIHLAAQTNARYSIKNNKVDKAINLNGTKIIVDLSKKYNVKKIVYSSSAAVYGDVKSIPTKELAIKKPISPYGKNKLAAEEVVKKNGISYAIFRYSNVFGPRQDALGEGGVISIFCYNAKKDIPLTIYGSGEQTRDFIYVMDVAMANVLAAEKDITGTFNISTNKKISINKLIEILFSVSKSKSNIIKGDKVKGDIMHSRLDNTRAKKAGLLNKLHDFSAALRETIKNV